MKRLYTATFAVACAIAPISGVFLETLAVEGCTPAKAAAGVDFVALVVHDILNGTVNLQQLETDVATWLGVVQDSGPYTLTQQTISLVTAEALQLALDTGQVPAQYTAIAQSLLGQELAQLHPPSDAGSQ